ncbi:MAG: hypothetical protein JSV89_03820 [Spirochaetaceae bacterium]|nr:MAG: hypothetical protein JSV89_03820 [Spirochaetaceae bacterium]
MIPLRPLVAGLQAAVLMLAIPARSIRLSADEAPPPGSRRLKTRLEFELEQTVAQAYRRCLRIYTVAGLDLELRIPFGQCGERHGSPGFYQRIHLGGKGDPEQVWAEIDGLLESDEFATYVSLLGRRREKTVVFELERKRFSVFFDPMLNDLLREGPYPGTRTLVYVLKTDSLISTVDVYNYLYCVGAVGLDCSGFVYNVQKAIAAALGKDLDLEVASLIGAPVKRLPQIIGLWFFDPALSFCRVVEHRIDNLRPGDMVLFRGRVPGRGIWFRHSAVIQSVDFERGLVRYLQCTDWAPPEERGVHDSWIRFDPAVAGLSLGDPGLEWSQSIQPTFKGETPLRHWQHDGHRYCSYQEQGGSLIVRLEIIESLIRAIEPDFYDNAYTSDPEAP